MYTILLFGTAQAVLIRGVSVLQGCLYFRGVMTCPYRGVPLFRGALFV